MKLEMHLFLSPTPALPPLSLSHTHTHKFLEWCIYIGTSGAPKGRDAGLYPLNPEKP
jgi:hypothetical protein